MAGATVRLSPDTPRIVWDGVDRLETDGSWARPLRIATWRLSCALSPALEVAGRDAAGVRFSLRTDAHALTFELMVDRIRAKPVDVLIGAGAEARTVRVPVAPGNNEVRVDLPGKPVDIEVWLPHNAGVLIGNVTLHEADTIEPLDRRRPTWTAYGSSLTQSLAASGPSQTWTAVVARRNGWGLRNLGLSSEAHLDQAVARAIRDTPADLITLELGINVYILASLTARTLASAIGGFIATIRDGHPDTPIAVWGPFVSRVRETTPNAVGLTLSEVRETVAYSVDRLRDAGDHHLHALDAAALLGEADGELLMDGLHPSAQGELVLADRIADALASVVGDFGDVLSRQKRGRL